jgi:hypothetical protein
MMRIIWLFTLMFSFLIIGGCASTTNNKNLGQGIRENHEVTRKYRSLTIDPNYHYYYSGRELQPDVVMGIDKKFTVQSKFWHQIDLTEEQLDKWVTWGDRERDNEGFSSRYLMKYQGAYILDPEGQVVGDWYSKKDLGVFEFPGNNIIIPHPPRNRAGSEPRKRW